MCDHTTRHRSDVLVLALLLILAGCSGPGGESDAGGADPAEDIRDASSASVLDVDGHGVEDGDVPDIVLDVDGHGVEDGDAPDIVPPDDVPPSAPDGADVPGDVPDLSGDEPDVADILDASDSVDVGPPDDTPPTVVFDDLQEGEEVTGEVPLSVTAQDDRGVVRVAFFAYDELLADVDGPPFETVWHGSVFDGGNYDLHAIAYDEAGNEGRVTIALNLLGACDPQGDCPPFNVRMINPVEGSVLCGTVSLVASAVDAEGDVSVEFFVDDESLGVVSESPFDNAPFELAWDTTAHDDGVHDVRAVATDEAGQRTFHQIEVGVSNFGEDCDNFPNLAITSPEMDAQLRGIVPVEVAASDDYGVVRVRFFVDNALVTEDVSAPYIFDWNTSDFTEGIHLVKAEATDTSDQIAQTSRPFTVDRTAPQIVVDEPLAGAIVAGSLPVSAQAADTNGIEAVVVRLDGVAPVTLLDPPYATTLDVSDLASGPYDLVVEAIDPAGNEGRVTTPIVVDRPPTVAFTAPAPDTTLAGTTTLAVAMADDTGLQGLTWSFDGTEVAQEELDGSTALERSLDFDTTALTYGQHTATATVTDASGQTVSAELPVLVDQPLVVALTLCDAQGGCANPPDPRDLHGDIWLHADVVDDNGTIESVEFFIDDTSLGLVATAPYELLFATLGHDDGAHRVRAVASSSLAIQADDGADVVIANCDRDEDGVVAAVCGGPDCDDEDPERYPEADDTVGDGVDQNCDGADGVDGDGDGHANAASGGDDCDDTDSLVSPSADDFVGDGEDQNCDGSDGVDLDGDHHATEASGGDDCDDTAPDVYLGAEDPHGDGRDQDCDGADGLDTDGDGFGGNCDAVVTDGDVSVWNLTCDCDESDPDVNPGADDPFGDGVDTDCDGADGVDHDLDGHRTPATGGDDCDDEDRDNFPGNEDPCDDGADNNCDGVNGVDADGDGHGAAEPSGGPWVDAGDCGDCDDGAHWVYPGAPDNVGNGLDENCDGVDGVDADRDGEASELSGGEDCDDDEAGVHTSAADLVDGFCRFPEGLVVHEAVDATGQPGLYPSLVVDDAGTTHLAFYEQQLDNLKYANDSTGDWFPANVDFANDVGRHAQMASAPDGSLRVVYQDATSGSIKLATRLSQSWETETVPARNRWRRGRRPLPRRGRRGSRTHRLRRRDDATLRVSAANGRRLGRRDHLARHDGPQRRHRSRRRRSRRPVARPVRRGRQAGRARRRRHLVGPARCERRAP